MILKSPFPRIAVITSLSWTEPNSHDFALSSLAVSFMPETASLTFSQSLQGSQSHTWWWWGLSGMMLWGHGYCSLVTQRLTQLLGAACGGGTEGQQAGLHSLFLQPQFRCYPCFMLLCSQHVIWTKTLKDQEITSEALRRCLLKILFKWLQKCKSWLHFLPRYTESIINPQAFSWWWYWRKKISFLWDQLIQRWGKAKRWTHTHMHRLPSQVEILRLPQWTQLPWHLGKFIFLFWDSSLWRILDILCQTLACLVSQPQRHRIPWLHPDTHPYLLEALSTVMQMHHPSQKPGSVPPISDLSRQVGSFLHFTNPTSQPMLAPAFPPFPRKENSEALSEDVSTTLQIDLMSHSQKQAWRVPRRSRGLLQYSCSHVSLLASIITE